MKCSIFADVKQIETMEFKEGKIVRIINDTTNHGLYFGRPVTMHEEFSDEKFCTIIGDLAYCIAYSDVIEINDELPEQPKPVSEHFIFGEVDLFIHHESRMFSIEGVNGRHSFDDIDAQIIKSKSITEALDFLKTKI